MSRQRASAYPFPMAGDSASRLKDALTIGTCEYTMDVCNTKSEYIHEKANIHDANRQFVG